MRVLDPRAGPRQPWPGGRLWVHLEAEPPDNRLAPLTPQHPLDSPEVTFYGPGWDSSILRPFPQARRTPADPEPCPRLDDLATLPLPSRAGFGPQGPLLRILAGRGDRVRPVAAVIREVVYAVESWQIGHLLFDDADLDAFPGWRAAFAAELAHLPWTLTWEARAGGARVRGRSRGTREHEPPAAHRG